MVFNLSEVTSLSEAYKASGLGQTWPGSFLAAIATEGTPPRGRGISILEDLLHKGIPESWELWPKVKDYLKAAETCTVPAEAKTLKDFAARVLSGKDLTERQRAYAEKLMAGAVRVVEMVEITDETRILLWSIDMKMQSMSRWYWGQKTATYNRLRNIFDKSSTATSQNASSVISKEDLDYVLGNFKGYVALWERTAEYYGSLCQVTREVRGRPTGAALATGGRMIDVLVVGNRTGDAHGQIVVDCLVEGAYEQVNVESLVFPRRPRKKKVKV